MIFMPMNSFLLLKLYNNRGMQRKFIIGDEWLFFKIYCGPKTADEILTNIINPVQKELKRDQIIDKWFFIRYADPKTHLRVRFHYDKSENVAQIINALNLQIKPLIEQDIINKLQIDTYNRELERYGDNTIELVEDLFSIDSEMIVEFLDMIEGDEGEIIRWLFGLRAVDNLLNDFEYKKEKKLAIIEGLKDGFGIEFGMNKMLKLQLDKKFRKERNLVDEIFNDKYKNEDISNILDLLRIKSERITPIANTILEMDRNGSLKRPLNDFMASYIHMLLNRLFRTKQRLHEMVIYDFLYRYYKSDIAKQKYQS